MCCREHVPLGIVALSYFQFKGLTDKSVSAHACLSIVSHISSTDVFNKVISSKPYNLYFFANLP